TRFSHKLDYENFQDLKFNIQQEMTETVIENSPIIQRIHKYHQPAHQIIDAKQDDTVRQSEQKPQVGDLSKHIDGQNSPEKPT
ncbi:hypothetical protein QT22_00075, partial [Staphylococcus aureus]